MVACDCGSSHTHLELELRVGGRGREAVSTPRVSAAEPSVQCILFSHPVMKPEGGPQQMPVFQVKQAVSGETGCCKLLQYQSHPHPASQGVSLLQLVL